MVAKRYAGYGIDHSEMVAAGSVGLCIAAAKFDPTRGIQFSTYARHWIRNMLFETVMSNWSQLAGRRNSRTSRMFFGLRRELSQEEGSSFASLSAVAERNGVDVEELARFLHRGASLDSCTPDTEGWVERTLALATHQTPEHDAIARDEEQRIKRRVDVALAMLDPREREIVRRRIMRDDADKESLAELAREWGVSRERARQLENRAMAKLRLCLQGVA